MLKLSGSGLMTATGISVPAVAKGNPGREDGVYEQALHVMERTGSVAQFRRYLSNHGVPYTTTDITYSVPKTIEDDEASTEYLDEEDLQIWLTLSRPNCNYPGRYRTEISFDWSWQGADDWGEAPDDAIGITFSDRHFWIPDEDGDEFWTNHSNVEYDSQGAQGIGFAVDDALADDGQLYSAGCKLRSQSGTSDPLSSRKVYGEYEHTYDGSWASIGYSVGSISLSWSSSGGSWDTNEDHNDVPLVTNPADLDHDDCETGT